MAVFNGCGIGRLKRYVIGHTAENRISDAFACNIMGYTRFILFIFADIVKKCRGVDDFAVKFELFLEILDPHNASDIQQVVDTVAAEDAPRFQLCNVAQMPPTVRWHRCNQCEAWHQRESGPKP